MKSLPPDIESLLETERRVPAPPTEAQARVRRRVEATLGLAAAAAVTATAGATQAATTQAATGATQAVATVATKAIVFKLVLGVVGTALLGGGAYVALQHKSAPPITPPPVAPLVQPAQPLREPQRLVIPPAAPQFRAIHIRAPQKGIADEQAFLEEARAALLGGSPERALRLLSQHQRDFPAAQLGEARDSMMIQALVAEGRIDQARAKAAEFRRRHPHSLFQPAVDASLPR